MVARQKTVVSRNEVVEITHVAQKAQEPVLEFVLRIHVQSKVALMSCAAMMTAWA